MVCSLSPHVHSPNTNCFDEHLNDAQDRVVKVWMVGNKGGGKVYTCFEVFRSNWSPWHGSAHTWHDHSGTAIQSIVHRSLRSPLISCTPCGLVSKHTMSNIRSLTSSKSTLCSTFPLGYWVCLTITTRDGWNEVDRWWSFPSQLNARCKPGHICRAEVVSASLEHVLQTREHALPVV